LEFETDPGGLPNCHIGHIFAYVAQVTKGAGVRRHGGDFETEYVLGCKLLQTVKHDGDGQGKCMLGSNIHY